MKTRLTALLLSSAAAAWSPAMAQDATSATGTEVASDAGEILVTATRRNEALSDGNEALSGAHDALLLVNAALLLGHDARAPGDEGVPAVGRRSFAACGSAPVEGIGPGH